LRLVMLGSAAPSMFGWISSDILGTPRQLFAFARDGCSRGHEPRPVKVQRIRLIMLGL